MSKQDTQELCARRNELCNKDLTTDQRDSLARSIKDFEGAIEMLKHTACMDIIAAYGFSKDGDEDYQEIWQYVSEHFYEFNEDHYGKTVLRIIDYYQYPTRMIVLSKWLTLNQSVKEVSFEIINVASSSSKDYFPKNYSTRAFRKENFLKPSAIKAFSEMLKFNKTIEILDMKAINFTLTTAQMIADALENNKTLKQIKVKAVNALGIEDKDEIKKILTEDPRIILLD